MLMVEMDAKPPRWPEKLLAQKDQQDHPPHKTVQALNNLELALNNLVDHQVEDQLIHGIPNNHQVVNILNQPPSQPPPKNQLNQQDATLTSPQLPVELPSKTPKDASLVTSLGCRFFSEYIDS